MKRGDKCELGESRREQKGMGGNRRKHGRKIERENRRNQRGKGENRRELGDRNLPKPAIFENR